MRLVIAIGLAAALLFSARAASADEATLLAKEHFRLGTKLYDLQRYAEAADEYEKAFDAKESPALLYNIGQAYRLAGEHQKALGAYRSYLRRLPDAPNRVEVVAFIDTLRKTIDAQKAAHEKPPTTPLAETPTPPPGPAHTPTAEHPVETPPPPPPVAVTPAHAPVDAHAARTLKIAGLSVAGLGVVAFALSPVFATLARSAKDDLDHPAQGTVFRSSLESKLTNYQGAEFAMIAVGGVAVVTGAVLYAVGWKQARAARLEVTPSASPTHASLTLTGSF